MKPKYKKLDGRNIKFLKEGDCLVCNNLPDDTCEYGLTRTILATKNCFKCISNIVSVNINDCVRFYDGDIFVVGEKMYAMLLDDENVATRPYIRISEEEYTELYKTSKHSLFESTCELITLINKDLIPFVVCIDFYNEQKECLEFKIIK